MSPLTDSDLSEVKTQDGLSINPELIKFININALDDSDDFNKLRKISGDSAIDAEDSNTINKPPINEMTQSISYPNGSTGKANESGPNVVNTPMRTYTTGRADFSIKPFSWVDVKVR
jgi:hypothetical protein